MVEVSRRTAITGAAATFAIASAADAAPRVGATKAAMVDPMSLVDTELRPFLKEALAPKPGAPPPPPRPARYRPDVPAPTFLATPSARERRIPGAPKQPAVKLYVIGEPRVGAKRPAILHMHGGGFVSGRVVDAVPALQKMAQRLGAVIVTVEYRIAPETRYPGSLEDNYAALRWMHAEAGTLGIDPARIAVTGESAGGGHAAMLAIAARDRGGPAICAQVLTYPMLDDRTGSTHPVPPSMGAYVWQAEDNRFGWSSLLGVPPGSARVPANAIPARVTQLAGLPPTFIAVGSIDLFAEEDMTYAARLAAAGVPTDLHVYPGAFHGFDLFVPTAWCSREFEKARDHAFTRAFT